ncbi:zinc carboxypeptidase, putative [Trypanosoma cruzi]|uniref:Zinc carboxypeptidase, putative n=1 Tax=Trypanosoma cruzi (strain CL Brener) TaxID=353153 RepID=Q4E2E4_TRYCC|nr:zinc carboxypeptidase, putative [Trypanosoma cruzi]EAN98951.1 zinc carboxypeptidase, putative [Trypanosoma cruzi]|eukprot:XP_820802.1 zinc carboxypeptidase [Trypanosoma cruzi strain CL Brener]
MNVNDDDDDDGRFVLEEKGEENGGRGELSIAGCFFAAVDDDDDGSFDVRGICTLHLCLCVGTFLFFFFFSCFFFCSFFTCISITDRFRLLGICAFASNLFVLRPSFFAFEISAVWLFSFFYYYCVCLPAFLAAMALTTSYPSSWLWEVRGATYAGTYMCTKKGKRCGAVVMDRHERLSSVVLLVVVVVVVVG